MFSTVSLQATGMDAPKGAPKAIVAADGSGTFTTVQAAINAAPVKGQSRFVIQIKPGVYKEKVVVSSDKGPILLIGSDRDTTKITYEDYAGAVRPDGKNVGTSGSYSILISSDDFEADNLTFENSHGKGSQAVAVRVDGDRAIFKKCRFDGFQDTLLVNKNRQYFENCYIDGAVDFIFGAATCFFESCELHAVARGYLTAASTPQVAPYGYVFSHCQIIGEGVAPGTEMLGRPWGDYGAAAYLNCQMDACIAPVGWFNWNKPAKEKTARYSEYHNTGPGAKTDGRVPWSHQLSDEDAASYTVQNVLGGSDGWNPTAAPSASP